MKDFAGKTAVITGGGTGMGRELAIQLVAEGCNVAMCDVIAENMAETRKRCLSQAPQGTRVSTFKADVSIEDQVKAFADAVARDLDTDRIHLLLTTPALAAAVASSTAIGRSGTRPSMSAGTASTTARAPSCRC